MSCQVPNCPFCTADKAVPCPSLQSAKPADPGFDVSQVVALFQRLDPRGQALTWALMQAADRLQGKRG
jgi:hypothetical protein